MTDTLWADVAEFQVDVDNRYPYRFLAFRSNDGTYRDHHFAHNLAWSKHRCETHGLDGFIVYFVFETNWRQTIQVFKAMVGVPHRRMAVMIDLESWGGKIQGDHSAELKECREHLIAWLGSYMSAAARVRKLHRRRVIGYGNVGDLLRLWRRRYDTKLIVAGYGTNPSFPNKLGHQFGDHYRTAPFGYCDINSADGYSPQQLAAALGLTDLPNPKPVPVKTVKRGAKKPPKHRAPKPVKPARKVYTVRSGDTFNQIAAKYHLSPYRLGKLNSQVHNRNLIYVGQHLYVS